MRNRIGRARAPGQRDGVRAHANQPILKTQGSNHGMKHKQSRRHSELVDVSRGDLMTFTKNFGHGNNSNDVTRDNPFELDREIKERVKPPKNQKKISEALFPLACCDALALVRDENYCWLPAARAAALRWNLPEFAVPRLLREVAQGIVRADTTPLPTSPSSCPVAKRSASVDTSRSQSSDQSQNPLEKSQEKRNKKHTKTSLGAENPEDPTTDPESDSEGDDSDTDDSEDDIFCDRPSMLWRNTCLNLWQIPVGESKADADLIWELRRAVWNADQVQSRKGGPFDPDPPSPSEKSSEIISNFAEKSSSGRKNSNNSVSFTKKMDVVFFDCQESVAEDKVFETKVKCKQFDGVSAHKPIADPVAVEESVLPVRCSKIAALFSKPRQSVLWDPSWCSSSA